jgi:hypothetical protein
MEANEVKFIHLRTYKPNGRNSEKGGGTVAYRLLNVDPTGGHTYAYYISHVNPKDNFNAYIGRLVSKGRLLSLRPNEHGVVGEGIVTVTLDSDADPHVSILKEIGWPKQPEIVLTAEEQAQAAFKAPFGDAALDAAIEDEALEGAAFPGAADAQEGDALAQ